MENKGVGIFDSGVGGLTVLKEIRKLLPGETLYYLGDTARVPYGNKSKDTVIRYSIQNTRFLLKRGIKLLVVACNTSSSYAMDTLRKEFSGLPIIGVIEPGSRQAIEASKSGHIGVIGTKATIKSNAYKNTISILDSNARVYQQACPLFVPIVEEGMHRSKFAHEIAKYYLEPIKKYHIDTLILGCTHYPLLSSVINNVMVNNVKLINSGKSVAKKVYEYLLGHNMLAKARKGGVEFFVTDAPEQFKKISRLLLSEDINDHIKEVVLEDE